MMFSRLIPLLIALAATSTKHACRSETLYITADNIVQQVCVNGVPNPAATAANKARTWVADTAELGAGSPTTGDCIAVEAWNTAPGTKSGIVACAGGSTALLWNCAPAYVVKAAAGTCCAACGHALWSDAAKTGVSTRPLVPPPSVAMKLVNQLPDECKDDKTEALWYWYKDPLQPKVCCTIKACAPRCLDCAVSGPAACDECMFGRSVLVGNATAPALPAQTCKSRCCFQIFTGPNDSDFPRIVVTNKANNIDTTYRSGTHFYFAMLDIDKCELFNIHEFTLNYEGTSTALSAGLAYRNVLYFDVWSGAPKPWITAKTMSGAGKIYNLNEPVFIKATKATTCVTGYQGGVLVNDLTTVIASP